MSKKRRRLVYNADGQTTRDRRHLYPITPDQYYDAVEQLVGTHVDTYVQCIGSPTYCLFGDFESARLQVVGTGTPLWRSMRNLQHLKTLGIDPHTGLLQRAKERGFEAIASIRMNDAHFAYSPEGPEQHPYVSPFWLEHPEFRIDPRMDTGRILRGTPDWKGVLFDYSHAEVRQRVMDMIDDLFERVDADGVELDFMRHPYYFKPEEAPHKLGVMTEFVRTVRNRLDAIGKARNRSLALGALVPATPEAGRKIGLDGITWIQDGLLDYIVPKHIILFVMDVPVEEYLEAAAGTGTQVHACLDMWPTGEAGRCPIESFRGAAAHYWDAGVDGIYLYNFFAHRPHPHTKEGTEILQEIGDRDLIMRKDKRYALTAMGTGLIGEDWQLPLEISGRHVIHFSLGGDSPSGADEWPFRSDILRLTFRLESQAHPERRQNLVVEEDVLEFRLNGSHIAFEEFRAVLGDAAWDFSGIECSLPGGRLLRKGRNELVVVLKQRCEGVSAPLVLTDVEVITRYG